MTLLGWLLLQAVLIFFLLIFFKHIELGEFSLISLFMTGVSQNSLKDLLEGQKQMLLVQQRKHTTLFKIIGFLADYKVFHVVFEKFSCLDFFATYHLKFKWIECDTICAVVSIVKVKENNHLDFGYINLRTVWKSEMLKNCFSSKYVLVVPGRQFFTALQWITIAQGPKIQQKNKL